MLDLKEWYEYDTIAKFNDSMMKIINSRILLGLTSLFSAPKNACALGLLDRSWE